MAVIRPAYKSRHIQNLFKRAIRQATGDSKAKQMFDTGFMQISMTNHASEVADVLMYISHDYRLPDAVGETVVSVALREITAQAARMQSNTGDTMASSFYVDKIADGQYMIDSDVPYKNTWTHPMDQGAPEISSILDWMRGKWFAYNEKRHGKSKVTQREAVAFLIARAIRENRPESEHQKSHLRGLHGSRERYFDYPKEAMRRITREAQEVNVQIDREMRRFR